MMGSANNCHFFKLRIQTCLCRVLQPLIAWGGERRTVGLISLASYIAVVSELELVLDKAREHLPFFDGRKFLRFCLFLHSVLVVFEGHSIVGLLFVKAVVKTFLTLSKTIVPVSLPRHLTLDQQDRRRVEVFA